MSADPITETNPFSREEEVSGIRSGPMPVFRRHELAFERVSCCAVGREYLFRTGAVVRLRVLPPDADYEAWPPAAYCPFCGTEL
jgi:hypothetical protein